MTDAPDLSVVVPCLDEEANVGILVERLLAATSRVGLKAEVVLVDDGSTDGTWAACERARQMHGSAVVAVRHPENRGIAAAWRTGVRAASGVDACFIDADLQNPPEEVCTLYRRLRESQADIVQGTRSSIGRIKDSRLTFSRGLNLLLNIAFRTWAADSKSGFVMAPRRVLEDVVSYQGEYHYFQTFISVAAKAKGYSILEVETLFQSRQAGRSFLTGRTLRVSLRALADFPTAILEFGRRRHPHEVSYGTARLQQARRRHPYGGWRRLWFETYFATMPLHAWLITRRAKDLYLELKQTEWLPREELDRLQLVKLQRLLQHAYIHVPYYRDAMHAAGIHPERVTSLADLSRLPLLSKDDVRGNLYFGLFADDHRKGEMLQISTSGSTGEPFVTYADRYQLEARFATTLRALELTGWRFGDRQARLWHQTVGMSRTQVVRERVDAFFMRRLFVPAFELSPERLDAAIDEIRAWNPVLVDGYAESLNFLATYVREGGSPGFSPRAMVSSAQSLLPGPRQTIEDAFGTRVFDKYGSREFSGIAYECEHAHGHHVMDESYVVELIVDGRPAEVGEVGEVVITDLNNFSVPLIRYRIGDLARAIDQAQPCPCGRMLSRIGEIEGRTQAIVHCADGTWLPGTFFGHLFKDYEFAIRFFQVYQREPGSFTLRLVKNTQFTAAALDEILGELKRYTGRETVVTVEFVDEIPLLRTGKRSPVVSDVELDFQSVASDRRVQA